MNFCSTETVCKPQCTQLYYATLTPDDFNGFLLMLIRACHTGQAKKMLDSGRNRDSDHWFASPISPELSYELLVDLVAQLVEQRSSKPKVKISRWPQG